jgi:hypothetical protein
MGDRQMRDPITAIAATAARRICGMFGTMDYYRDDIAAQVAMAVSEGLPRLLREQTAGSACGYPAALEEMRKDGERLARLTTLHPAADWHEDFGAVLWWHLPICEPPSVGCGEGMNETDRHGKPTSCALGQRSGWLTHWSRIPIGGEKEGGDAPVPERKPSAEAAARAEWGDMVPTEQQGAGAYAFLAGRGARTDLKRLIDHPHPRESQEANDWEDGWKSKHYEMLRPPTTPEKQQGVGAVDLSSDPDTPHWVAREELIGTAPVAQFMGLPFSTFTQLVCQLRANLAAANQRIEGWQLEAATLRADLEAAATRLAVVKAEALIEITMANRRAEKAEAYLQKALLMLERAAKALRFASEPEARMVHFYDIAAEIDDLRAAALLAKHPEAKREG